MNFRNVPEPLVYRGSHVLATVVGDGDVGGGGGGAGGGHAPPRCRRCTRSSSNSFSDTKRAWARGGGWGQTVRRGRARVFQVRSRRRPPEEGPAHLRRRRALESGAVQRQDGAALRVALGGDNHVICVGAGAGGGSPRRTGEGAGRATAGLPSRRRAERRRRVAFARVAYRGRRREVLADAVEVILAECSARPPGISPRAEPPGHRLWRTPRGRAPC